jgi:hypothetical protein
MIQIYYADQNENGSHKYEVIYKRHYIIFDHVFFDKRGDITDWELMDTQDEFNVPVNLDLSDIEIKIMLAGIELYNLKNK